MIILSIMLLTFAVSRANTFDPRTKLKTAQNVFQNMFQNVFQNMVQNESKTWISTKQEHDL